jgi:hypothetical protein
LNKGLIGGALQALTDHGIGIDVLTEKARGIGRNGVGASRRAVVAGHRCGSANADRLSLPAEAVPHPAHEHGHVGALPATISVKLIKHDEFKAICVGDHGTVEWILPRHQQFEHHEIGEQDVRLRVTNALALIIAFLARMAGEGRTQLLG